MVNKELLAILRCPVCVHEKEGLLTMEKESWLVCKDCDRKYPINNDIPRMLIEKGDQWKATKIENLPVPPPLD